VGKKRPRGNIEGQGTALDNPPEALLNNDMAPPPAKRTRGQVFPLSFSDNLTMLNFAI
jgi:hypothetical protein